jgi:hypothetical protein
MFLCASVVGGGTGHFGITIADGVRNACWDNYAVDC